MNSYKHFATLTHQAPSIRHPTLELETGTGTRRRSLLSQEAAGRWGFSLIELMIVVTILAALVAIVLPQFNDVGPKAVNSKLVIAEARRIESAYLSFLSDCAPSNHQYPYLALMGLYPLVYATEPQNSSYSVRTPIGGHAPAWHRVIRQVRGVSHPTIGWAGPYLVPEARGLPDGAKVHCFDLTQGGQEVSGKLTPSQDAQPLPVVFDPYYDANRPQLGRYYRIIASRKTGTGGNTAPSPWRLSLVFVGPNGKLDLPHELSTSLSLDYADTGWVDAWGYISEAKLREESAKRDDKGTPIFDDQVFPLIN